MSRLYVIVTLDSLFCKKEPRKFIFMILFSKTTGILWLAKPLNYAIIVDDVGKMLSETI